MCYRSESLKYAVDEGVQGSGSPERVTLQSDEQGNQPAGSCTVTQQTDAQHSDSPGPQRQQPQGGCQCESHIYSI